MAGDGPVSTGSCRQAVPRVPEAGGSTGVEAAADDAESKGGAVARRDDTTLMSFSHPCLFSTLGRSCDEGRWKEGCDGQEWAAAMTDAEGQAWFCALLT